MLIRIVKMTFRENETEKFMSLFSERKHLIASFEGCNGVQLLRDISNPCIFFTYSNWNSEAGLNSYRDSALFNEVWNTVKPWFADKPEAWSVEQVK